ncbi:hypothetical protein BB560_001856 [Smittium megazygosporum]|uniref:AAA+ ATPase domain-containing protein n=1 Tax=Smittium megazygosporum TaxID=133381 RepID=A0A2T9ZGD8_9FUNG|nr:hypothetical protein BB560_001856 [Smittium megazygosporum]
MEDIPISTELLIEQTSSPKVQMNDRVCQIVKTNILNTYLYNNYMVNVSYGGINARFKVINPDITSTLDANNTNDFASTFYQVSGNTKVSPLLDKKNETLNENSFKGPKDGLNYTNIGGLSEQITQIREIVEPTLINPSIFTDYGLVPPRGVLLYGPPGTGKTLIARSIAGATKASLFTINGAEVINKYYGETEQKLTRIFQEANENTPSIIFIDEIDALCPKRSKDSHSNIENRIVTTLLTLLDGFSSKSNNSRVIVLAATNRPNSLDDALRRPGRFDREVEISVPNLSDRLDILMVILKKVPNTLSERDLEEIAGNTHGFVGADLMTLCRESSLIALKRCYPILTNNNSSKDFLDIIHPESHLINPQNESKKQSEQETSLGNEDLDSYEEFNQKNSYNLKKDLFLSFEDFKEAMPSVKPSGMREIMLEIPKVYWDDIGGQDEIKSRLIEAVEWPLKSPELFTRMGINPPKGILLYGPPGCSKTLVAKALATESRLNFIAVKGPELFSKYVGESEKAVKQIFKRARLNSPSIIFFDEIDALTINRSSSSGTGSGGGGSNSSVSERVLSQLLTELDGIEPLVKVTVLAATNRPDVIDPALLRPGRFDRVLYVPPPDYNTRLAIFKIQLKKMSISQEVSAELLAEMTEGFSGAEVVNLCQESALAAMEEDIDAIFVQLKHFKQTREKIKPRISKEMIEFYTNFRNKNKSSVA